MKTGFIATLLLLLGCSYSSADVIELLNGSRISGRWINPSQERPAVFEFETEEGVQLSFDSKQVRKVTPFSPSEKEYFARPPLAEDISAYEETIKWCEQNGLRNLSNAHRERILDLDPNHKSARDNLDYIKTSDGWVRQDRFYANLGMIKKEGKWRFPEDVAVEESLQQQKEELAKATKEFDRHWRAALTGGPNADQAMVYLNQVNSPLVATRIREMLYGKTPTENSTQRAHLIEILSRIQAPAAVAALGEVAIKDPEDRNRRQAVEHLKKYGAPLAVDVFEGRLRSFNPKSDTPEIVNRLGYALGELSDKRSIPILIERLVTEHQTTVNGGGNNAAGLLNGGGGGVGLNQGNKTTVVAKGSENREILSALTSITTVNYGFNKAAWLDWYANNFAKTRLNLRRDP